MKKTMMLLLALACALGLTACQTGGETPPAAYQTDDVQAIADGGAFSEELEELDGDTAFALYKLADCGLDREALTDCAVLRSAGATCEEAAVLVFDGLSQDQLEQVEQALRDYIQGQVEANEGYRPAEIPKLENAWIDRAGESILLVVANDLEAAKAAVG